MNIVFEFCDPAASFLDQHHDGAVTKAGTEELLRLSCAWTLNYRLEPLLRDAGRRSWQGTRSTRSGRGACLPHGVPQAIIRSFSLQARMQSQGPGGYASIARIGLSEEQTAVLAFSTALIDDQLSTERGSSFFDEKALQAV